MKKLKGLAVSLIIFGVLVGSVGLIYMNTIAATEDTIIGMFTTLEDPDPAEH